MAFDAFDQILAKRIDPTPLRRRFRPACDDRRDRAIWPYSPRVHDPTKLEAIKLAVLGEGDMIDVEIETHADCVCRHQVIDIRPD